MFRFLLIVEITLILFIVIYPHVESLYQARQRIESLRTETELRFESSWCNAGCTTLSTWNEKGRVADGHLMAGLAIAYHYNPQLRPLAIKVAGYGTRFEWGEIESTGQYHPLLNVITLHESVKEAPLSVLASILTHEIAHAYLQAVGMGPISSETCIQGEVYAYSWGADTWEKVRLGTEGERADFDDHLLQRWRQYDLRAFVTTHPSYREICGLQ